MPFIISCSLSEIKLFNFGCKVTSFSHIQGNYPIKKGFFSAQKTAKETFLQLSTQENGQKQKTKKRGTGVCQSPKTREIYLMYVSSTCLKNDLRHSIS